MTAKEYKRLGIAERRVFFIAALVPVDIRTESDEDGTTRYAGFADLLGAQSETNRAEVLAAVKKERFGRLQDRLNSLGWLGLCDERTFVVKSGGCWTRLKLVDPESEEARAIP